MRNLRHFSMLSQFVTKLMFMDILLFRINRFRYEWILNVQILCRSWKFLVVYGKELVLLSCCFLKLYQVQELNQTQTDPTLRVRLQRNSLYSYFSPKEGLDLQLEMGTKGSVAYRSIYNCLERYLAIIDFKLWKIACNHLNWD